MPRSAKALARAARVWDGETVLPEVVVARGSVADSALLTADDVDVLAVPVAPAPEEGDGLEPRAGTVDAAVRYGIDLAELAERGRATGAPGDAHVVDLPRAHGRREMPWTGLPERVILLGVGDGTPTDLRKAGAALARATRGASRVLTPVAGHGGAEDAAAFVEGYALAAYRMPTGQTSAPEPGPADQLVLLGEHPEAAVVDALRAARATWLTRDLTNAPANIKDPAWFAARATALADDAGLASRTWDVADLTAGGFGGILAVGAGSASEPRLVTVTYDPVGPDGRPRRGARHVVLVGKGITYDTGGLSIKPREAMVPMKTDMAGAAVALATVLGAAAADLPVRVTAVLPLAENHFSGGSYRPGDVLRVHGGTTVEVSNTDAEGRLVLADALAYADAELDPDVLIDVATLTGAASMGLGPLHGALYSADAELVGVLEAAGRATGEPVWQMPLVEDYAGALDSTIADVSHVPLVNHGGGSITAALFLRRFVGERRWAHLDIAGPARSGKDRDEVVAGATGYGARLLLAALRDLA